MFGGQIRNVIAARLCQSKRGIPHAYASKEVAVDNLVAFRKQIQRTLRANTNNAIVGEKK